MLKDKITKKWCKKRLKKDWCQFGLTFHTHDMRLKSPQQKILRNLIPNQPSFEGWNEKKIILKKI